MEADRTRLRGLASFPAWSLQMIGFDQGTPSAMAATSGSMHRQARMGIVMRRCELPAAGACNGPPTFHGTERTLRLLSGLDSAWLRSLAKRCGLHDGSSRRRFATLNRTSKTPGIKKTLDHVSANSFQVVCQAIVVWFSGFQTSHQISRYDKEAHPVGLPRDIAMHALQDMRPSMMSREEMKLERPVTSSLRSDGGRPEHRSVRLARKPYIRSRVGQSIYRHCIIPAAATLADTALRPAARRDRKRPTR